MAKFQQRVDATEERALKVERAEKKAQVIQIKVRMEMWCSKEKMKAVKAEVVVVEQRVMATNKRATMAEVDAVKQAQKAVEDF